MERDVEHSKLNVGWMGWDGYTTTAVTPRASFQNDANNGELHRFERKSWTVNWTGIGIMESY